MDQAAAGAKSRFDFPSAREHLLFWTLALGGLGLDLWTKHLAFASLAFLSLGVGLLATGGGAYENNAEGLFSAFDRIVGFLLAEKAGELFVGGCKTPADLPDSVKEKAKALAKSLVA